VSLVLLTAAVAMVSIASIVPAGVATAVVLVIGLGFGVVFVLFERTAKAAVLPRVTFAAGTSLKWVYLTVGILAFGIGTEAFIPLFGQELGKLSPLLAGFLGAALSLGWSLSQTVSASATRASAVRRLIVGGPVLLAIGLGSYSALQADGPSAVVVALWFVTLFAAGAGIGVAFPHLAVAAFSSVEDNEEAAKASAGINTVFLMSSAFSAALAGVLVKLGEPSVLSSARLLLSVFAVVALLGAFPAWRIARSGVARKAVASGITH
jgi:hypothetical protein